MSQLITMIVRSDDSVNPTVLTEVWRQALPSIDLEGLDGGGYLDGLESTVMDVGWAAMRCLVVEQWRLMDAALVAQYRQAHPGVVTGDGYDDLKVVSRLGVVQLPRQVCVQAGEHNQHDLPGNAALPAHEGQVTTRGVQEWACLLPQDLPFAPAQRLLGWITHDPEALSETQVRRWVATHGQLIRAAEQAEVEALQLRPELIGLRAQLAPLTEPRRPAAWPAELNQAVEVALAEPEPQPPAGVTLSDWERVLHARQAETTATAADLRRLGPEVQPGQIIASTDDIEVRRPERHRWLDLRTAYVRTAQGDRYLSGSGELVLKQLYLLLLLCGGGLSAHLTLLGDGARWIAKFFTEKLATWPGSELILDWYHCRKKCYDLTSLICRGRLAKAQLLGSLLIRLWRGQVDEALATLEAYRPQAKNLERLDSLIQYLKDRRPYLPNYKERRAHQQYIGSAHTEKANDLLVARRQKHQGMHWSETTSDALAALRTLLLNGGWDLYWQQHQVLPLAMPSGP